MPKTIERVNVGVIIDKSEAYIPDCNRIKAFPDDSPFYEKNAVRETTIRGSNTRNQPKTK